jgi:signal transduction histidine kinase
MQKSVPSSSPLLTLLDLVDSPFLLFHPDGHVVFANRAAKAMDARPGVLLPSDPQVRLLVNKIGQNKVVAKLDLTVEVNADVGVSQLHCQCAPKTVAGLVAMAVTQVKEPVSQPHPLSAQSGPERLTLQQIVSLIKGDLATPIEAVLAQTTEAGSPMGKAVQTLKERLERLSDLVNVFGEDVLIEDDRLTLPSLVRSVCQELAPRAQAHRVRFVLEGDQQDLPPVYGSGKLIRRALFECLCNAINHAQSAVSTDQTSAIRVGFQFSGQHLMISVANIGVLTANALSRHASNIFQAAPIAAAQGSKTDDALPVLQIGLPLTHRILELHGGRLRIEDANGELEVKLELPTGAPQWRHHHLDLLQAHIYAEDLSTLLARSRKQRPAK